MYSMVYFGEHGHMRVQMFKMQKMAEGHARYGTGEDVARLIQAGGVHSQPLRDLSATPAQNVGSGE